MNLKAIDAAIGAYRSRLDDADNARLAFFRELWAVQDDVARTAGAAAAYAVPSADDLRAWSASGEPAFAHAPVAVDAAALADALARLAGVLVARGGFSDAVNRGLARTKWDRIVAASPLALAGSNPAAYAEEFAELLVDDGLSEDAAHVGGLAATLALRALLDPAAAAVAAAHEAACAGTANPVRCPACGALATLAHVRPGDVAQGGGKELWCAQCGSTWPFERVRCGRCGTQNQAHLHYFNLEGDEAHRLATCDECGGYVRTVYQTDALAPFSCEVEDVVMAKLDLVAYQRAAADAQG